jgi:hypothetical protein
MNSRAEIAALEDDDHEAQMEILDRFMAETAELVADDRRPPESKVAALADALKRARALVDEFAAPTRPLGEGDIQRRIRRLEVAVDSLSSRLDAMNRST